jgi:hypothetical protein
MVWPAVTRYGLSVAPGNLGLVQDFLNTIEEGSNPPPDLLTTLESAQEWADSALNQWILVDDQGWAKSLPRITETERVSLIALRDQLFNDLFSRTLPTLSQTPGHAPSQYRPLVKVSDGRVDLVPDGDGWKYFETALLLICYRAQIDGTLRRMKTCKSHTCDVVFYDRSNNNSAVWHDVKVCGNRANVRAFRERTAAR